MALDVPFLRLPPELRNLIYHPLCDSQPAPAIPSILDRSPLAISLVCKQLYRETYALVVSVTPLWASSWDPDVIRLSFLRVLPAHRPLLKTLSLSDVRPFALGTCPPFSRVGLVDAGLRGFENLSIAFSDGSGSVRYIGGHDVADHVAVIFWSIAVKDGNEQLQKIRIVDNGTLRTWPYNFLHLAINRTLKIWKGPPQLEATWDSAEGQCHLLKRRLDGTVEKDILLLLGRTAHEAETFGAWWKATQRHSSTVDI
jgi:hypothetical protein